MNGPEHYRQAELLLSEADIVPSGDVPMVLQAAQVHATLALTAATATQLTCQFVELDDDAYAWNEVSGTPARAIEDVHLPDGEEP